MVEAMEPLSDGSTTKSWIDGGDQPSNALALVSAIYLLVLFVLLMLTMPAFDMQWAKMVLILWLASTVGPFFALFAAGIVLCAIRDGTSG